MLIRWVILFLIVVVTGLGAGAAGQEFDSSELDTFIDEAMTASTIPGLAVVIFDPDKVVYEKAFGIAGPDQRPVTLDTPFQLGSVSKSFAAVVMVQLAGETRIDLDAPVITYLPEFRTKDKEHWKNITVRQVLSHRSGFAMLDGNRLHDSNYRGDDSLPLAVKGLDRVKLKSIPGSAFEYSNANYFIAAAIIEAVTGKSYEKVIRERVFLPLGMHNSYVQMPTGKSVKEATGYRQWFGNPKAFPNIAGRAYVAAGGVTASARDLAVYLQAMANRDPSILPAAYADTLISPGGNQPATNNGWDYGLGWMIQDFDGTNLVFHSGLNGGFAAHAAFIPEEGRGALVLTNQSGILQADVPGVVARKGLGLDPGPARPTNGSKIMIWSLAATVIGLLFFYGLSTWRFAAYARRVGTVNKWRRVLPSLALFALAYGFVVIIPNTNAITLGGIKVFYPDLWLCLTLSAAIAVLWGMTRLIYPFKPIP